MDKTKQCLAVLLMGTCMVSVPVSLEAQTVELRSGLEALFKMADKSNATLKSMQIALDESRAGVEVAKKSKLPDVNGHLSFSYLGNATTWNRHFQDHMTSSMPHFGNNFLLHAEQMVYSGGAVTSGIKLARQNEQMQELTTQESKKRIHFLLVGLYLQLHSLHNQSLVYAQNKALAQEQIKQMQKRHEQGVSLRNDVTRYELQLQQIALGEVTVKDREDIVRKQLKTALGVEDASIPMLGDSAFNERSVPSAEEEYWQRMAMEQHIELQKSALQIGLKQTQEKIEKASRLPKISLVAENHLDGPITIEVPPINKNLNYWFVGVGINYDFSSLYKSRSRIRRARISTSFARQNYEDVQQGVNESIHTAYVDLHTARTQLETRKKSLQLALENYELVSKRYQNGLSIVTDLTDAANVKLDAELSLVNARINLIYAYYNLKYITNTPDL